MYIGKTVMPYSATTDCGRSQVLSVTTLIDNLGLLPLSWIRRQMRPRRAQLSIVVYHSRKSAQMALDDLWQVSGLVRRVGARRPPKNGALAIDQKSVDLLLIGQVQR